MRSIDRLCLGRTRLRRLAQIALALCLLAAAVPRAAAQAVTPTPAPGLTREPALDRDEARRLSPPSQLNELTVGAPGELSPRVERKRLSELRDILSPASTPESALRIKALEGFLDYDQEDQIVYGPGRTQVYYGQFFLEGDKVIIDTRLQEIQAEGDVVMKVDKDTIHADSLRYNFQASEGVAYNVTGSHDPIYFSTADKSVKPSTGLPQFQKVSRDESIFRNTNITTCDFKVPHYHVKGREVVVFGNDRVFFRGATFYIWGVPSFYLPFYTHSLVEASPWSTELGYGSRTGFRIREMYTYHHRTEEPSLDDDSVYEVRSQGKADVFVDYLTKHGLGAGMDYNYSFDFDRHRGEFSVYSLPSDTNRKVVGPTIQNNPPLVNDSQRWSVQWLDRLAITPDLTLTINVDEFSDPDIFYDVLDFFGDTQDRRNRQIERGSTVALTWVQEAYVARIMASVKDRIGLNRWNDFSNPRDNDLDYELDPSRTLAKTTVDGISSSRWGRVSEQLPHFTLATRDLPIARSPLYYNAQLDVYNALDKGLNIVSTQDDAFVKGAEFYQQLLRQWKLSQRYVLLWKAGFGIGYAERNDMLGIKFPTDVFPQTLNDSPDMPGPTFIDNKGTFLVGTRKRNLDQIKNAYVWADTELHLNARFSDALRGDVGWRYRETTRDFIGDFYASLGSNTFREDLYNYKIRENWVDANLEYRLAQPLLTVYANAAYNLEPKSRLYSQEDMGHVRVGYNWSNQRQTLVNAGSVGYSRVQLFDPTDPAQFQENVTDYSETISYSPVHQRWYTRLSLLYHDVLNGNASVATNPTKAFFSDERPREEVRWTYGRELGPKWDMEYTIDWDKQVGGLRETALILKRDMHDAVLVMRFGIRNSNRNVVSATNQTANQTDLRVGLKLKLPEHQVAIGAGNVRTLQERARQPAQAY